MSLVMNSIQKGMTMNNLERKKLAGYIQMPTAWCWVVRLRQRIGFVLALTLGGSVVSSHGGTLDSPATPTNSASAMFTLQDIYNRLNTGAAGVKRTTVFAEPSAGPTIASMCTLNEVMAMAPVVNANAATESEVLSGRVFWGLNAGEWGQRTGTMAAQVLSDSSTSVEAGYYSATTLTDVEPDLVPENIAENVTIFGVTGTMTSIPMGVIVMWSGASDNIPAGWVLCDGSNGAPDLRDRFIVGAGNTYEAGSTGGSISHTHPRLYVGTGGTIYSGSMSDFGAANNLPPYYALCFIMKQ